MLHTCAGKGAAIIRVHRTLNGNLNHSNRYILGRVLLGCALVTASHQKFEQFLLSFNNVESAFGFQVAMYALRV
jgi:hypothetical protein